MHSPSSQSLLIGNGVSQLVHFVNKPNWWRSHFILRSRHKLPNLLQMLFTVRDKQLVSLLLLSVNLTR
ncbi:hypothetical protein [Nostoc sp. PCC 9305]|uniref:hypothetical protein n=1 Tax=Nostoc sp. PCC 9305 TaxID=296636 RepID=UPI0039C5F789